MKYLKKCRTPQFR